ncbi:MAG: hypothetical protein IPI10_17490 [Bacteroidetes bacterium]|nr:hypothetical protein [Bacteroidota bacterium]
MEDDFTRIMNVKIQEKLRELEALQEALNTYNKKMGYDKGRIPLVDHSETKTSQFPDYPNGPELFKKMVFLSSREKLPKWWKKQQLEDAIIEQEGNQKSLTSLNNQFRELIDAKELIMIKYSNSNKLVFYTTDKELLYSDDNGLWVPIYESLPSVVKEIEDKIGSPECSLNK